MIIVSIRNNINRLIFVKIPNRLSRYFQYRRNLLRNIRIDFFSLFK